MDTNSCFRGSHSEVFLRKSVLKICSKFTGEHPCRSVISIKLLSARVSFLIKLQAEVADLGFDLDLVFFNKVAGNCGLVTCTEEILKRKLHFLCSV